MTTLLEFLQQLGTVLLLYPPLRLLWDVHDSAALKGEASKAEDPRHREVLNNAAQRIAQAWQPHYLWVTLMGTVLTGGTALVKLATMVWATWFKP